MGIIGKAFLLLETNGCRIELAAARESLAAFGCVTDSGNTVKFPEKVLLDALQKISGCPQEQSMPLVLMVGSLKPRLLEYRRKISREGSSEDAMNIIKLFNALPFITIASTGILPFDVPREAVDVVNTAMLCKYSRRLFTQDLYSVESAKTILDILNVVAGKEQSRKPMIYKLQTASSLRYKESPLEIARLWRDVHLPIAVGSSPRLGGRLAVGLSGELTLITAEWLSGIAYLASISHEAGILLFSFPTWRDAEQEIFTSPELTKLALGIAQIGERLGYPCCQASGYVNVSWWNLQNGWEKAITSGLTWANSGICNGYAGLLGEDFSPEQLVLDHYAAITLYYLHQSERVALNMLPPEKLVEKATSLELSSWQETETNSFWDGVSGQKYFVGNIAQAHEFVEQTFHEDIPDLQLSERQVQEVDNLVEARLQKLEATK
jgi:trimethylamine:corrinoid methyltransferase-like protein